MEESTARGGPITKQDLEQEFENIYNTKTPPYVYQAIANVTGDLAKVGISKDSTNSAQGFKFRSIDAFYNALAPLLAKHGLVIIPRVISRAVTERQTNKGGILFSVVLDIEYDFVAAKDGSIHTARFCGEASDSGDKGTNKALSAGYKYCVMEAFCVPVKGHIDDADADTPDPVVRGSPFPEDPNWPPTPQPPPKKPAPPKNHAPQSASPPPRATSKPEPKPVQGPALDLGDRSLEQIEEELVRELKGWQFPVGRNAGKTLLDLGYENAVSYANWVQESERKTGKPPLDYQVDACRMVELYRKLRQVYDLMDEQKAYSPGQFDPNDEIPF